MFSVAELQVEDKPCDQETTKLSLCRTRPIWADGDNNQQDRMARVHLSLEGTAMDVGIVLV